MSGRRSEDFARVYDEHVWDVYGYFGYRVRSREEAEELTQETFERALRAWPRFDERRASPRTWLLVIARNLLIDRHRRGGGGREVPLPEGEAGEASLGTVPPPEQSALGLSADLETALARLSERDRGLLALRFGGDLTTAEIARVTRLSVANVQQILSRALRRLRQDLEGSEVASQARPASRRD